uniref:Uncharacterized protein n=1 Tax=Romanomermis culicivorax TaxID=13658 RepID=A0A915I7Z1_ROMCU
MEIPTETDVIQIDSEEDEVSRTDTTGPMTAAKTTSSLIPLSKNLSYNISQIKQEDGEDLKMIRPQMIPMQYKIPKKNEVDTSTPVSTESTTPVLEDYLESHLEDPNYVPPSKKRGDSREDTRSRECKETDSRTRERPSGSTAQKESDDYDS